MSIENLGELKDIPVSELFIDHEWNHRGRVAPIDVIDLAKSIERDGLQSPINVQPYADPSHPGLKYKVVDGHRRAMSFHVLKRKEIPAFVKVYENDLAARSQSLIANIQRKNLNIKQEAQALKPFLDAYWGENELADHFSQSRGWVKIRIMLLNLDERVQDYAAAGLITQEHIKVLQGKSVDAQMAFIREVKEAKAKGEKIILEKTIKKVNPHEKKIRGREEIFTKISEIYGTGVPMGLWSRCLSWAAGQITEYELMKDIEEWAIENGKPYRIPNEMLVAQFAA